MRRGYAGRRWRWAAGEHDNIGEVYDVTTRVADNGVIASPSPMEYAGTKIVEVVALVEDVENGQVRTATGLLLVMIGQAWSDGYAAGEAAGVVKGAQTVTNRLRRRQHRRVGR